jgi:hypothetical protein
MILDWLCCHLYYGVVQHWYGNEDQLPFFWNMPSSWRWKIWRFTSRVYCRAFRYQLRSNWA